MDYDVALRLENVESQNNKQYHCKISRYIKIYGPWLLDPSAYTFLHWIKAAGVKIRTALKKTYLFHELEDMKNR